MARIFPDTAPAQIPKPVLRTFKFLKSLPDDYLVWHHLAPWTQDAPDFLVLNPHLQALLLKVSPASMRDTASAAQALLFGDEPPKPGATEAQVLDSFVKDLSQQMASTENISTGIVFPNVFQKQIDQACNGDPSNPVWIGKEAIEPGGESQWPSFFSQAALDELSIAFLRQRFSPEIVVPSAVTVRTPSKRQLEARMTDFLLDYDQESALKTNLNLPVEEQSLAEDFSLNVVYGVAGSGKTLVLLFRLRLLAAMFPQKQFLVLTHNRPLIHDMKARFYRLNGTLPENIRWRTFNGWCREHWPAQFRWVTPMGSERRERLLQEVWEQHLRGTNISTRMLRMEIDWIKDRAGMSRPAYLAVERRGRGIRLTRGQRATIFDAMRAYQDRLSQGNLVDWADIPRRMWKAIRDGDFTPPQYDAVFIDEAQFFAPIWFETVQRLVRPRTGHLFIAADPTQGFLRQGISWKSLGLDVRGHTHRLTKSYRTTQAILNFATLFYRQRVTRQEEALFATNLLDMPQGPIPELIPLHSSQDEITLVANEVESLAKANFPLQDLLILHANWEGVLQLIRAIRNRLGQNAAMDPKDSAPGPYVRVTTLNAGTGIESPIVFLVGLRELFEEEQSLRISDAERDQLVLENTRKIYMAMTRAGQRLVFTYTGEIPDVLKDLR